MTLEQIRDRTNELAEQMAEVDNKLWDCDKEETDRLLEEYQELESEYFKLIMLAMSFAS